MGNRDFGISEQWNFEQGYRMSKLLAVFILALVSLRAAEPDLILHGGKVVTVDNAFSIREAVSISNGKIQQVGSSAEILKSRGPKTDVIDVKGRMVLPGLMDSHSHPADAAMFEFDHAVPDMETIADVLAYIRERARVVPAGSWIEVHQVFITRLKEQRYPTRSELDSAAPQHPVIFATGPDCALNTMAMKISGIDRDFKVTDGGSGFAEKDANGEPTGILRNASRYVKANAPRRRATDADRAGRLKELLADYNSVGLTSVCDRNASPGNIEIYKQLHGRNELTVRVNLSHQMAGIGAIADIEERIRTVAKHPLFKNPDDYLRIIGIKMFLDGGMLTGSAYMREPWGVSEIYSIKDPSYRGVLFIPRERLVPMIRAATGSGLQFTAHSVGDGAVHTLLDAYEEILKEPSFPSGLACISHSNFMSREAVEKAKRLGVFMDIQPAWLNLDARTLEKQFGYERLRYFQPLKSIFDLGGTVGGGSDHMQKIGSFRSINFYNPFLGMQTAITRRAKNLDHPLHPEEALNREQAIRFYTINNAKILRCEEKLGSLEPGKLADLILIDTDILTCPAE
ncbi:MAG TPA: amidohydrolase, partial [Verrucomicrobiae bacterium]|nr:amidohydrolase [Verrucomicrobiae bacterium]